MNRSKVKKGLLILNPGDGKNTSTFGVLLRAQGGGFRVCVVQAHLSANFHEFALILKHLAKISVNSRTHFEH